MNQDPNNLIWIDLEMTGLDVDSCAIIEIALVITDKDLNELGRWPCGEDGLAIHQSAEALAAMDEWCCDTHAKSGLLERVRNSSVTLAAAEIMALNFVQQYCPPPSGTRAVACPLAGNSIGQDRAFLQAYMPRFEQYTSYRNVDVSTIKELVNRWYPNDRYVKNETGKHSAMPDIQASIMELQYYRSRIFRS
jgi:oligoribonuclease